MPVLPPTPAAPAGPRTGGIPWWEARPDGACRDNGIDRCSAPAESPRYAVDLRRNWSQRECVPESRQSACSIMSNSRVTDATCLRSTIYFSKPIPIGIDCCATRSGSPPDVRITMSHKCNGKRPKRGNNSRPSKVSRRAYSRNFPIRRKIPMNWKMTMGSTRIGTMTDPPHRTGPSPGFEMRRTEDGQEALQVPVRKVGISGIGAGGKRPRSISQEAVRRTKNSSRPLRASTDRSLPRARGSVAAAGPPLASRRARSGAGCCNRSGAMADSGVRPAWDAGEPGASGCGRTPPIGRRP